MNLENLIKIYNKNTSKIAELCAKFSLFEHKTSVLWTEIWRGENLEAFKTKEN